MRAVPVVLLFTVLSQAVLAQVGPGLSVSPGPSAFFDLNPLGPFAAWANGNSRFYAISAVPLPATAGQWLIGLTVYNPVGGAGYHELRIGTYTPPVPGIALPATFVWDVAQDPIFNTNLAERAISFNPEHIDPVTQQVTQPAGTLAVFERVFPYGPGPSTVMAGVFLTTRPSTSSTFSTPVQVVGIRGIGANPYPAADPALGYIGDRLKVFYFGAVSTIVGTPPVPGLWMDDLYHGIVGYPPFAGVNPQLIAVPSVAGNVLHAPTPLVGADGDVEGLWYSEADTLGSSDQWFADDLDPATPGVKVIDNAMWLYNGMIIGGQFLVGDTTYNRQFNESYGAWMLGDKEPAGLGNPPIDVTVGGHPFSVCAVFLSDSYGPPLSLPPWFGFIGLNLANLQPLAAIVTDGHGLGSIQIPNVSSIYTGTTLFVQGVVFEPTNNVVFTNTARLRL